MRSRLASSITGLGLLLLAGCGGAAEPRWVRLAVGAPAPQALATPQHEGGGPRLELDAEGRAWLATDLDGAWEPGPWPGVWVTPWPFSLPEERGSEDERIRLSWGEREGAFTAPDAVPLVDGLPRPDRLAAGSFGAYWGQVFLVVGEGETAPALTHLRQRIERGSAAEGVWRVSIDGQTADALEVWPGEQLELERELPAHSELRFDAFALGLGAQAAAEAAPVRLRVELDGALLHECALVPAPEAQRAPQRVRLPEAGAARARLRFAVEGPPALTSFLEPRIVPLDAPPADERPDLVLFLADTFRADALAAYGGAPETAPALNAFAQEARTFTRAWTTAPWTLPSHASLFSGLYPRQHGVVADWLALGSDAHTLAELLTAAGYRTAAVTDSAYVSARYGLDQGFQSFVELPWFGSSEQADSIDATLGAVRAALAGDDGRPLFLFVQSYRAHTPYFASEGARGALEIAPEPQEARWAELHGGLLLADPEAERPPGSERAIQTMRAVYQGACHDLDRGFGELRALLEEHDLSQAVLAFTSDHGEAFDEHGVIGHGDGLWEEELAVPLLLRVPGLEPARDERLASLVDLAPTLARLAGLEPPASWSGHDLLGAPLERELVAYRCPPRGAEHCAVRSGAWKYVAREEGGRLQPAELAYELSADPGERINLVGEERAAASARHAGFVELFGRLSRPQLSPSLPSGASAAQSAQLDALGYGGD